MMGFFEHQYLSYKKNHIKNLVALGEVRRAHASERRSFAL